MKENMSFDISIDRRYMRLMDRVVDLQTGFAFDVGNLNPIVVCEIFKNQFIHSYKTNLMETDDVYIKMKKLIYPLLSFNENLVLEYEIKYGKTILNENINKLNVLRSIEESWEFVKRKMLDVITFAPEELLESWLGDKWDQMKSGAKWVGDKIQQAAQWVLNKGLPWFFGKLENFLLSPVGIGIDVALTALGIGKVASSILWGALGVWKIYKLLTGQSDASSWFTYVDIALCLVGLVFTGGAASGIKSAMKAAGRDIRKLLSNPIIKPIFQLVGKGFSFINNVILKPMEWLAKTLGGPKITDLINKAKSGLGRIVTKLDEMTKLSNPGLVSTAKTGIKTDIINPIKAAMKNQGPVSLRAAAQKGTAYGLAFYGGEKLLHKGAEAYGEYKTNKSTKKIIDKAAKTADDDIAAIIAKHEVKK